MLSNPIDHLVNKPIPGQCDQGIIIEAELFRKFRRMFAVGRICGDGLHVAESNSRESYTDKSRPVNTWQHER